MTQPTAELLQAIKGCPFCGAGLARGPGRYTNASFSGVELTVSGESTHRVICGTCGAEGPPEASEIEAIASWNFRVPCKGQANEK